MEIEDLKRDSARLSWLIGEAYKGREHLTKAILRLAPLQYIDWLMAQAKPAETNADAERARWCEEMKATVERRTGQWMCYYRRSDGTMCTRFHEDRNTAIDKARGVVK
jgi:hypothetical protein